MPRSLAPSPSNCCCIMLLLCLIPSMGKSCKWGPYKHGPPNPIHGKRERKERKEKKKSNVLF
ncbi:hypothetical protein E1A91_D13G076400v1 [Gossypium mustelinum]|uniref:Secreted protein n=1 Tax=Gossypium mustelinum TaxID=34275 RepID=A0A5D2S003_GOSMU|nr:hypothetical protein E1A91_D13G076400v1 [Gossypium mustelinum]